LKNDLKLANMNNNFSDNCASHARADDKSRVRVDAICKWFAHSGKQKDFSDWQPLNEHLGAVAILAADRAKVFGAQDWAFLIGLLHDLGKYSKSLHQRLQGSTQRSDHATASSQTLGVCHCGASHRFSQWAR
jgi:hypothetical protein